MTRMQGLESVALDQGWGHLDRVERWFQQGSTQLATFKTRFARAALIVLAPLIIAGCGINTIPTKEERAKAQWAEVQNQYQRRADLIPNLVATVKGYAAQERDVLVAVTQARASATQTRVDASTLTDPVAFQKYQAAQDNLSGVLGRLMVISAGALLATGIRQLAAPQSLSVPAVPTPITVTAPTPPARPVSASTAASPGVGQFQPNTIVVRLTAALVSMK